MVVCVEERNKGRDVIREEGEMRSGRPRNARWCALKRVGGNSEVRGWMVMIMKRRYRDYICASDPET